jgi:hypothetical protein
MQKLARFENSQKLFSFYVKMVSIETSIREEVAKMETVKIEEPKTRVGSVAIKAEYLLQVEVSSGVL